MDRCATRVHPPWIFLLLPLGKSSRGGIEGSVLSMKIGEVGRRSSLFSSRLEKWRNERRGEEFLSRSDLGIGGKIPWRILRTFHDQPFLLFGIRSRIPSIFGLYSCVGFFNSPKFSTRSSWVNGIKRKISKIIPKLVFNSESNPILF